MKLILATLLVLGCLPAAGTARAQGSSKNANSSENNGQTKPATNAQTAAQSQKNANPFPEDEDSVPVIPTTNAPVLPPDATASRLPLPAEDRDPVRTPEEEGAQAESNEKDSSSSLAGMSDLLPPADDNAQPGKHNKKAEQIEPEHQESAKEDENVGAYYMDNKDWKGALSRYESALVLDPDNPDVYWGLAECQRHLGDYADARANYLKVMAYDPGSHHAKDARKALEDPQIANAKPAAQAMPHPQ